MYQIIPFKRESWKYSTNNFDEIRQLKLTQKVKQFVLGGYKKLHWKKKTFE